jgi:hypothetical protein
MFGAISNTWNLLGSCVHVLGKDKELLLFPIISGIVSILVLASFAGGAWGTGLIETVMEEAESAGGASGERVLTPNEILLLVVGFCYYYVSFAVIIYFNAALIGAAHIRLTGGDPTIMDGLRAANACLPSILLYALIAATVGLILKAIRENSNNIVARIIAGLIGFAWTLLTFLVIPVMVVERKSAFAAIGRSGRLLRDTWGEQIVSNIGFGLISFLLALVGGAFFGLGVWCVLAEISIPLGIALGVLAILYWIALGIMMSALRGIFVAALYAHAAHEPLQDFPPELVADAFRRR